MLNSFQVRYILLKIGFSIVALLPFILLNAQVKTIDAPGEFIFSTDFSFGKVTKETEYDLENENISETIVNYNTHGDIEYLYRTIDSKSDTFLTNYYDSSQRLIKSVRRAFSNLDRGRNFIYRYDSADNLTTILALFKNDSFEVVDTAEHYIYDERSRLIEFKRFAYGGSKRIVYRQVKEYIPNKRVEECNFWYSYGGSIEQMYCSITDSLGRLISEIEGDSIEMGRTSYKYDEEIKTIYEYNTIVKNAKKHRIPASKSIYYKDRLIYQGESEIDSLPRFDEKIKYEPNFEMHIESVIANIRENELLASTEDVAVYNNYECWFHPNGLKKREVFSKPEYDPTDDLEKDTKVIYEYTLNSIGLLGQKNTYYQCWNDYSSWLNHNFGENNVGRVVKVFEENYQYNDSGMLIDYSMLNTSWDSRVDLRKKYVYNKDNKLLKEMEWTRDYDTLQLRMDVTYHYNSKGKLVRDLISIRPPRFEYENDTTNLSNLRHRYYDNYGHLIRYIDTSDLDNQMSIDDTTYDCNGNIVDAISKRQVYWVSEDSMAWDVYKNGIRREYNNTYINKSLGQGLAHVLEVNIPEDGTWLFDLSNTEFNYETRLESIKKSNTQLINPSKKYLNMKSYYLKKGKYRFIIAGKELSDSGIYSIKINLFE